MEAGNLCKPSLNSLNRRSNKKYDDFVLCAFRTIGQIPEASYVTLEKPNSPRLAIFINISANPDLHYTTIIHMNLSYGGFEEMTQY